MNLERWQDIKTLVETKFGFDYYGQEKFEIGDNDKGQTVEADREIIEFNGPLGKMRLEFEIKPVVLDKKVFGSKRIGGENNVTYVYSEDEKTYKLRVYKLDEASDSWVEIDASGFLG
ncbi:MAG: hypothetical protein WCX88_02690 [Patescibacteria group bacterium]